MTKSALTHLFAQLRRRFSPRLTRLGADGPRTLSGGGTGALLVLVGRELSLFLHVDASAVPQKQRAGFVALEVRRAAPFPDPDYDAVWLGSHAAVWYWSRSRVAGLLGSPAAGTRWRAEGAWRGEVTETDGAELLSLEATGTDDMSIAAGHDARLWRRGHIVASRWWRELPSAAEWQAFLRGGGMDPTLPLPEPTAAPLRAQPLGGGFQPQALAGQLQARLPLMGTVAGALVLALLAWQLAGVLAVSSEIRQVEAQTVPLEQQLQTVIDARARADDAMATIDGLLSLRPPSSQTRLLAEVASVTPGTNWQLVTWHMPGPDTLEVTFQGGGLDTAAIVTAWEQSPLLHDVSPSTGAGMDELVVMARLTPLSAQLEERDSRVPGTAAPDADPVDVP